MTPADWAEDGDLHTCDDPVVAVRRDLSEALEDVVDDACRRMLQMILDAALDVKLTAVDQIFRPPEPWAPEDRHT